MHTERVTYDVMTPSAARGLIESIYWHPGLRYSIEKIFVLNPINTTNIRRNEVKSTLLASSALASAKSGTPIALFTQEDIQQRAALILKDVHYVIETQFFLTKKASAKDNPGKFHDIICRRLKRGQCYSMPYFGCREFAAHFREWDGGDIPAIDVTQELGFMLYDMNYSNRQNIQPKFFRAKLEHGVLDCRNCEVYS